MHKVPKPSGVAVVDDILTDVSTVRNNSSFSPHKLSCQVDRLETIVTEGFGMVQKNLLRYNVRLQDFDERLLGLEIKVDAVYTDICDLYEMLDNLRADHSDQLELQSAMNASIATGLHSSHE
ncbi:MAG: hypothetical protein JWM81_810 [Candidatus Saccharibacteria bacterium]|nr:hypothetical protein [Candidatus Saccharibacteria bacterium]